MATLALGTTGVAYAQTAAAPSIDATGSVSPGKAGTKSKPKHATFKLSVKNNPASKTTAKSITIEFPSTLKVSTKGLNQCTVSDDTLITNPGKCSKAKAGPVGSASALLNPFATAPAPLSFKVQPYVGKNELLFKLSGSADAVLHGKISGKKLTIAITTELQKVAGTYSALNQLATTISAKKGSSSLITSTGCKGGKHSVKVTVGYANNPAPPSAPSASDTMDLRCS